LQLLPKPTLLFLLSSDLFEVAKCGFKTNIKLYQAVNAPDIVGCLAVPVMKYPPASVV
jgi:hypothetical protein